MREQQTSFLAASLLGTDELRKGKNLLAFSAGSDSTALFFLLQELQIPFDIAIVNYHLRQQSNMEVAYAKKLAQKYGKKIYTKSAPVEGGNIEAQAREIRYRFFETIITEHHYTNLVTAHHLGDLTEWFMMQLSKGAGLVELIGMEPIQYKKAYTLIRPMLFIPKKQIMQYLTANRIHYFHDESNDNLSITRNFFRHTMVNPLLNRYAEGIAKSFRYLLEDKKLLQQKLFFIKELVLAPVGTNDYETKRILDKIFKYFGYVLSSNQKEEMLRQKQGIIAGRYAFAINKDLLWAAPKEEVIIPKNIKEQFRRADIPVPLRGYIYKADIDLNTLMSYKQKVQTLR